MCSQLSRRLSGIFLQHLREGSSQMIHFYPPPSYHICLVYSQVSLRCSLLQDSYTVVNAFTFTVPPRLGRHISLIYKWKPNTQCDFCSVPEEIYLKSRDQNLISLTTMGCSRRLKTALSCTENLHKTSNSSRTPKSSFTASTTRPFWGSIYALFFQIACVPHFFLLHNILSITELKGHEIQ